MAFSTALQVFIHLLCFGFFSYQLSVLMSHYLNPGPDRLHTALENQNLSQANISLVFKICYNPPYNISVLNEAGYPSALMYFLGQRYYGTGLVGWAGQNKTMDVAGRKSRI